VLTYTAGTASVLLFLTYTAATVSHRHMVRVEANHSQLSEDILFVLRDSYNYLVFDDYIVNKY